MTEAASPFSSCHHMYLWAIIKVMMFLVSGAGPPVVRFLFAANKNRKKLSKWTTSTKLLHHRKMSFLAVSLQDSWYKEKQVILSSENNRRETEILFICDSSILGGLTQICLFLWHVWMKVCLFLSSNLICKHIRCSVIFNTLQKCWVCYDRK